MSNITVTLPDGSPRELPSGSTALDLANSIGRGLAKAAVAAVVDGAETDLTRPLRDGAKVALVTDSTVLGIHGPRAQAALGDRLVSTHELPAGEEAKPIEVVSRLWSELTLDRGGTVVALGGGAVTDTAGFAAATYLRGVPWARKDLAVTANTYTHVIVNEAEVDYTKLLN